MNKKFVLALMGMTAAAGIAGAANLTVTGDITTSTTWTSNNVYSLTNRVFVRSGATLTIQPGTVCKSLVDGSLLVSRGGKIYVNGTKDAPVIMTSTNDNMTTWRVGCNEWGNLTLMGKGLISAATSGSRVRASNTSTPTGLNEVDMEGLTADGIHDIKYGGNNDNDDSGSIHYLSLRYGGYTLAPSVELNGLSLGGIGRETDISHVEIMNNLDDGIEIWGGTCNLKYLNIWNIGDDSLDIDQGWRGKAQFGLIVQGYSRNAAQGSGWGDNSIELDGAENSDAQPLTTAKIANFTVVGEPNNGDAATAWRDNARVQLHNSIFMTTGEEIVRLDFKDGDGCVGYGNGQLSWEDTWTTDYNTYPTLNWVTNVYATQSAMYTAQNSGKLSEMRGCLVFDSNISDANDFAFGTGAVTYKREKETTNSVNNAIGAFGGTYASPLSNPALDNVVASSLPIAAIYRMDVTIQTNKVLSMVTNINPCAAGDALTVAAPVTADGFFTAAPFRGGFSANNNWLKGWTAVDAYGMTSGSAAVDPSSTIQLTASTFFQTTAGVVYTVEESSDMLNWAPVATVTGDGSIMSATDLDAFNSAKFYRAIVL